MTSNPVLRAVSRLSFRIKEINSLLSKVVIPPNFDWFDVDGQRCFPIYPVGGVKESTGEVISYLTAEKDGKSYRFPVTFVGNLPAKNVESIVAVAVAQFSKDLQAT